MTADILALSVPDVLRLYSQKTLSPVDVAQAVLDQIGSVNPELNAFVCRVDDKTILTQARESEARWAKGAPCGALDGIPATSKDGSDLAGYPTRDGSRVTPDTPAAEDAPPEARLREAGVIFVGKTTTPEFGHKGVTDSPLTGITRNPWNPSKTPGGSSGGAGVTAATRMGYLHIGSDGGGSIRIPSSFCGVFGHRPSGGLVPRYPHGPFSSLAAAGPMTRTVEESAMMMDVIAQPDPRDGTAVPFPPQHFHATLNDIQKPLRIGFAPTIGDAWVDPEVSTLIANAAKALQDVGTVDEIDLQLPTLIDTFNKHWMSVAAWLMKKIPEDKHGDMDPYLREWAARGSKMDLADYISAEVDRFSIISQMQKVFSTYDVVLMPATGMPAFDVGLNVPPGPDGQPLHDWTPFTFPGNLGRLPAASLPCGMTSQGLPVGVQIISGYMKDAIVLKTAHALEQRLGFQDWITRSIADSKHRPQSAA